MLRRNAETEKSKQRWEPANSEGSEAGPGRQERGRRRSGRKNEEEVFFNSIGMQTFQHPNLSRRVLFCRGVVHVGGVKKESKDRFILF